MLRITIRRIQRSARRRLRLTMHTNRVDGQIQERDGRMSLLHGLHLTHRHQPQTLPAFKWRVSSFQKYRPRTALPISRTRTRSQPQRISRNGAKQLKNRQRHRMQECLWMESKWWERFAGLFTHIRLKTRMSWKSLRKSS